MNCQMYQILYELSLSKYGCIFNKGGFFKFFSDFKSHLLLS